MKKYPHIMVVDDDQEILEMLNRILELEGYSVSLAADGSSALALVEEHRPDLVILDIMMPEPDGLQVLNLMRQRYNFPVVMLTGKCEVTMLRRALALGADDYVMKPFRTRVLLARIRARLRRAEQSLSHS